MKDIELKPLVKTDDELLEEHSKDAWTPEYLYSQEFDAAFQKLFNEYLHGEFWQLEDHSDFQAFHRMFQKLKLKRNELEDKFFPERIAQRVEERGKVTEDEEMKGIKECYDKLHELTNKRKSGEFSWKNLFFGCFRRQVKGEDELRKHVLFQY